MKKWKLTTIVIVLLASLVVFTGCKQDGSDERLRQEGHFSVSFDCMGGLMGNYSTRLQYALPGSLLLKPGDSASFREPVLLGHSLEGWFLGEIDEAGRVTYGKQWDFSVDRMPAYDFNLFARWTPNPSFVVVYGENNLSRNTHYVLPGGKLDLTNTPPSWEGHTLLGYYADRELTIPFDFDRTHDNNTGNKQIEVYTKWLIGEYELVRSAADMRTISAVRNYYLLNDIDFEDTTWSMLSNFSGSIIGNGYTIRNISLALTQQGQSNMGLFSVMTDALISNVTFEDCYLTFTIGRNSPVNIGFFAGEMRGSTELRNVNVVYTDNTKKAVTAIRGTQSSLEAIIRHNGFSGALPPATVKFVASSPTNITYEEII